MTICAPTRKIVSPAGWADRGAGWLGLAAAPTFASMAWISAVGAPGLTICSAVPAFMPIGDMALMYLLMGLFHLPPWIKRLSFRLHSRDAHITQTIGD